MSEAMIKVEQVSKAFKLPHEKQGSIKNAFVNLFSGSKTYEKQKVLNDISFEIKKGEFFGIVGRNGSGKSTLLKLLAEIYTPDEGKIEINGKLTPFIELGVGFNPELTGRENVYLNGALLGFNRKEMSEMYGEIVEFAELEKFMDQKLKNYSSGMQVRLAFSIAIRAKSDILLVDEVLAVGDAAFQAKCFDVFAKLKEDGRTVILVTHDMNSVLRFCSRTMLINRGEIIDIGDPSKIADKYLELNYEDTSDDGGDPKNKYIQEVTVLSPETHRKVNSAALGGSIVVSIKYENIANDKFHLGMQVFNESGTYCFGTNSKISGQDVFSTTSGEVSIVLNNLTLLPGIYHITLAVMSENATKVLEYRPKITEFRRTKDSEYEGISMIEHTWEAS